MMSFSEHLHRFHIVEAISQVLWIWQHVIIPRENENGSKYKDNLQKFNNLKNKDNKRMKMNLRIKIKEDEDSPKIEDNLKHK